MVKLKKNSVCIAIPMRNEEKGAAKCVDKVVKALDKISARVGFIVVDGGSTDKTPEILSKKKKQYRDKLVIVRYKGNRGYGGALQVGAKKADKLGYTFVLFMDSDLTNDPKDIPHFVKKASDDVDCVKATRYSSGGKMAGVSFYRQIISMLGNLFASRLFGIGLSDCTNGFRMLRLKMFKDVKFKEKSFAIILEELYELKKRKAKFASVPVTLTSRANTKTHFSYSWRTFFDYGKYAVKALFV